jgi:peptide deformylase
MEVILDILEKCGVEIATVDNHPVWVYSRARALDLSKERPLAEQLHRIMGYYKKRHNFVGVSANNLYWNLTEDPIRVLMIPTPRRQYITLVNPEYLALEGKPFNHVEACGSVPGNNYVVRRWPYVVVCGYTTDRQYVELAYGKRNFQAGDAPVVSSFGHPEWIVQHEMDHLDGITIKDRGTVFDLSCLMDTNK